MDVSVDEKGILEKSIVTVKSGEKKNSWEVDGITGATISSRAIGDILAASTKKWVPLLYRQQEKFKEVNNE